MTAVGGIELVKVCDIPTRGMQLYNSAMMAQYGVCTPISSMFDSFKKVFRFPVISE